MNNNELYLEYSKARAKVEVLHAQYQQMGLDIRDAEETFAALDALVRAASNDALLASLLN